ncbi:MAG: flagellar hook capping protein [Syntrophomonadaceae bacterium]|jgi:flagellar basal-body rod modification protein FlgD|nr:flagellar hook capping protein [Syntrophomonadaceae bacterium]
MGVAGVSSANPVATNQYSTGGLTKTLGQDAFFKLLITQLRYQNPLEPMQDQEFIAQLATFSTLEQATKLNNQFEKMTTSLQDSLFAITSIQQATACLGNVIEYHNGEEICSGRVDSVRIEGGLPVLIVGGAKVDLSSVVAINSPEPVITGEESADEFVGEEQRGVDIDS